MKNFCVALVQLLRIHLFEVLVVHEFDEDSFQGVSAHWKPGSLRRVNQRPL